MQQINPALVKVWISPTTVQYGYPRGIRVANLTPPKERMLHFLEQGFMANQLSVLSRLAGCSPEDLTELMQDLKPLLDDWTADLNKFSPPQLKLLQPEIHRLLRAGKVPAPIIQSRMNQPVFISDLGRFGSLLLELLSNLGFSKFITSDSGLRQPSNRGGAESGLTRLQDLKARLPEHCQLQLHSLLHESTVRRIDLAILVEFEVCNPLELQFWQSHDVPLLRVRFAESGSVVERITNLDSFRGEGLQQEQRELAIIEAQLANAPRRLESEPEVISAAAKAIQAVISFDELNPEPLEN